MCQNIKGISRLQNISIPSYIKEEAEKKKYIFRLISGAKALAIYNIQSALRSSKVALIEHIHGTKYTEDMFNIKGIKKASSGNLIKKLIGYQEKLPLINFNPFLLPKWLQEEKLYQEVCKQEIEIYRNIFELTQQLSNKKRIVKSS